MTCQDCGDPADISGCWLDDGTQCLTCHISGCRECQDGMREQAAIDAADDAREQARLGRWS